MIICRLFTSVRLFFPVPVSGFLRPFFPAAGRSYGALFNSIFEFDKALVVDPVMSALPKTDDASHGRHFRIAIHTRHPDSSLKGDEMLDLYWGAASVCVGLTITPSPPPLLSRSPALPLSLSLSVCVSCARGPSS